MRGILKLFLSVTVFSVLVSAVSAEETVLLNVSYDPTSAFYEQYNRSFAEYWKRETGGEIVIRQSHGGSGKQARSVIDGLEADVVTLALAYDIDALHSHGNLVPKDWQKRFPSNSAPYTSAIVFLVRKGNPKNIKDWDDLVRAGISVITPNPKTSGGARWNYLAAWAYARKHDRNPQQFVKKLYGNVPVLDSGARGSTTTFAARGIGDVLLSWENEAFLVLERLGSENFEIVVPSISILAEPTVAVVKRTADKKGTEEAAAAYLQYLYSSEGQHIAAQNYYRPRDENILKEYSSFFAETDLVSIDGFFGGWSEAHRIHFSDGGTFDRIYGE